MYNHRIFLLFILSFAMYACSEPGPENLEGNVQQLVQQNEYEEALDLLSEADGDSTVISQLKINTHLAYANYLTHEADHLAMGDRMADALRHFRRVLELDETNSRAENHIELIEGIYRQMGRDIPEGVAD